MLLMRVMMRLLMRVMVRCSRRRFMRMLFVFVMLRLLTVTFRLVLPIMLLMIACVVLAVLGDHQLRTDLEMLGILNVVGAHDFAGEFVYFPAVRMMTVFRKLVPRYSRYRLALFHAMYM